MEYGGGIPGVLYMKVWDERNRTVPGAARGLTVFLASDGRDSEPSKDKKINRSVPCSVKEFGFESIIFDNLI